MWLRRLLLPACVLFWAAGAGAATLVYGNLLEVRGIAWQDGRLQMPLSRKKYADVRLLDRSLYQFLVSCQEEKCSFSPVGKEYNIFSLRAAKTRENMWIAQVDVNGQLLITFLIFKRADAFSIKPPDEVLFKDKGFLEAIEHSLKNQIKAHI